MGSSIQCRCQVLETQVTNKQIHSPDKYAHACLNVLYAAIKNIHTYILFEDVKHLLKYIYYFNHSSHYIFVCACYRFQSLKILQEVFAQTLAVKVCVCSSLKYVSVDTSLSIDDFRAVGYIDT